MQLCWKKLQICFNCVLLQTFRVNWKLFYDSENTFHRYCVKREKERGREREWERISQWVLVSILKNHLKHVDRNCFILRNWINNSDCDKYDSCQIWTFIIIVLFYYYNESYDFWWRFLTMSIDSHAIHRIGSGGRPSTLK